MGRGACVTVLGSIVLLAFYYAGYHNVPTLVQQQPKSREPFPTIVAFQKEMEDIRENCLQLPLPPNVTIQGWQEVNPDWYIYSAHLDNRLDTTFVRIVAMSKGNPSGRLFCRLWQTDTNESSTLALIHKNELWVRVWDAAAPGQYYHPYLLSCSVPVNVQLKAVSVVTDPCHKPSNLLNLTLRRHQERTKGFAVCLKPMDFADDIGPRLIEWLELQFLLGADSVLAYIHHLHPDTQKVLEHYTGKVILVDHSPPPKEKETNWTQLWQRRRLEVALYNDCFYRHILSHNFVVNLDLDEAIVPLLNDTWTELMKGPVILDSASVSVRNAYFFDALGVDPSIPTYLHMLRHVYRSANFTPPGFAQKSFFSTRHAEAVAHHYALRALLRPGGTRLMSGLDIGRARLHHYRSRCPALMERQCAEDFLRYRVRDTALWRFKEPLEKRVGKRMRELEMGDVTDLTLAVWNAMDDALNATFP